VLFSKGLLAAMRGRFDEARQASSLSVARQEELGRRPEAAATLGETFGYLELLAGNLEAAERAVRKSCEQLQAMGETGILSTQAAELALILCEMGRFGEAQDFIDVSRATTAADDVLSQAKWRVAQARVLTEAGRSAEAVDLAREAVDLLEATDVITIQADMLVELARALEADGRTEEAGQVLRSALRLYEQKGNVVSAEQTRRLIADLTSGT
jgi:tetratricopeptide (TPR) repeat protein